MTAVTEVLRLLDELRGSEGLLDRAGLAARGAAALRRLSPAQRRELAVEVARRAAPQLVPRIEAETGRDLTPAQVEAVMDLALRLDRNDIDDLITSLADADARSALGREVTAAAVRELDDELGLDVLPPPPLEDPDEGGAGQPTVSEAADTGAGRHDEDLGPELAELEAELAEQRREIAALEERAAAGIEGSTELLEQVAGELGADTDGPGPEAREDEDREGDDPEEPQPAEELTQPGRSREPGAPEAPTDGQVPPPEPGTDVAAGPHVPPPPPVPATREHEELVAPIRQAAARAGAGAALRQLAAVVDDLWETGAVGRTAAARAVPDGWARRRTLERLVRAGVVTPDEAPELLRLLDRPSDRTWVAGTMLADGLVEPDELTGLVAHRALERLRRRAARPLT